MLDPFRLLGKMRYSAPPGVVHVYPLPVAYLPTHPMVDAHPQLYSLPTAHPLTPAGLPTAQTPMPAIIDSHHQ